LPALRVLVNPSKRCCLPQRQMLRLVLLLPLLLRLLLHMPAEQSA
jgi:hypothetical protein